MLLVILLFIMMGMCHSAYAEVVLNLTPGVSPISHDIYNLHMTIFWICVAIAVIVFGVMFYSIIYHRQSRGAVASVFHEHPVVEVTWTIIPFIILVFMAIPATKVLVNMNNTAQEDVTVKITGYQWKWHYEYLEAGISFFSDLSTPYAQIHNQEKKGENYLREVDHPLVLPIHKKIRFLITSNDVNHAWWVPDFGVKRDAVPGYINEGWTIINKPGTYRGQCAELCGINHAFMPIVVRAVTAEDYQQWIAQQKGGGVNAAAEADKAWTLAALITQGEKVYNRICAACHQVTGMGLPPTFPALNGSKVATGPINEHVKTVFYGRPGTAMQAFKDQLNDVDLAAVITYERNAWNNKTGTLVQPIQIKALRGGKTLEDALTAQPSTAQPQAASASSQTTQAQATPQPSSRAAQSQVVQLPPSEEEAHTGSTDSAHTANQAKHPANMAEPAPAASDPSAARLPAISTPLPATVPTDNVTQ